MTWYKTGEPIQPKKDDSRVKVDYDQKQSLHILVIMDANTQDAGDYTAIARNDYGSFKFTVTVLVGNTEGAEIVKKTVESKRTTKLIEETIVDGKVVDKTVHEVTEEMPTVSESVDTSVTQKITESGSDVALQEEIKFETDVQTTRKQSKSEIVTIKEQKTVKESSVERKIGDEVKMTKKEKIMTSESSQKISGEEGQPPKFTQPPEPVLVDVGETIKLTCRVSG